MPQMQSGSWKEEHLFNLKELLESFDHLEAKILRYEAHIQQGLETLAPVERATLPVPVPVKPKSNKATLKEEWLRGALWRMSGVDLTAIDGIGVELARLLHFGQPYHDIGARAYEERFAVKRLAAITAQA